MGGKQNNLEDRNAVNRYDENTMVSSRKGIVNTITANFMTIIVKSKTSKRLVREK
jgi:hypothetical protein